jgi:hypothetical protein
MLERFRECGAGWRHISLFEPAHVAGAWPCLRQAFLAAQPYRRPAQADCLCRLRLSGGRGKVNVLSVNVLSVVTRFEIERGGFVR